MRTLIPATFLLVFAAACGSDDSATPEDPTGTNNIRPADPNNVSPNNASSNNSMGTNNTPSNNVPSNNTAGTNNTMGTNNASSNNTAGTNNATSNNSSGVDAVEVEPNDDRASANNVVLGDTISGTAESGGGEDVFAFNAQAGTILELEFVSAQLTPDVSIFVEDTSDEIGDRAIDLFPGAKRQFFLPKTDTWYITVRSFEVIDRDYEMAIRAVTPTPMTEAFSGAVVGDLDDHAVDVYLLPDANGRVEASLSAERLAGGSDLDSIMFVYSPNAGLVTFNDDSAAGSTTDSELDFTATSGETYWLVVDGWRLGMDNPYELNVVLP